MLAVGSTGRSTLTVTIGTKKVDATVRPNLFGSDLGVILGPEEYRGLMLVPRWEELIRLLGAQQSRRLYRFRPEALRYQAVGSLYHAIRQVEHILTAYGLTLAHGEKSLMLRAREAALAANLIALGLRTGNVDEVADDLRTVSREVLSELGQPRDLPKREGQAYLTELRLARDSRDRANETVIMVRAIAASNRFRERLEEGIMRIEPVIVMRQKALLNLHELAWFAIDVALDFVAKLDRRLESHRTTFLTDRLAVARTGQRLRHHASELGRIDFHPYLVPLRFVVEELRSAARDLPNHPLKAAALLRRSRESLCLAELQVELQRFIFVLMRVKLGTRPVPGAEQARQRLAGLRKSFERIDDSGFRFPVRERVLGLLDQANEPLAGPTVESCEIARDLLKQAGDVLGRLPGLPNN